MSSRPLIIGSGPNGLAAAFYLARAGRAPLVLERASDVGGGAVTKEIHPGFLAPLYTHDVLLHETIVREMQLLRLGLEILTPDADVCAPSPDGLPIVFHRDAARTARGLDAINRHDAEAWTQYREATAGVAAVLAPLLATPPPPADGPGARDAWAWLKAAVRLRALGTRGAHDLLRWLPMPVHDFVHEWFESEHVRTVVAASGLTGTMLGPRSAGSTLVLLLREAHTFLAGGAPLRFRGGPGACTRAMADAARAAGAEIRTGVAVERILTDAGQVTGVITGGREIASNLVMSSLDPKTTLLSLLEPASLPADLTHGMRHYRSAGTMAKINLAMSRLPAFTGVGDTRALEGRIHLGARLDDCERAFDHVKYGEMSATPWLDVTIPSLLDSTLAPPGAHVASIYVHNAPYRLRSGDWATSRDELLQRTLDVVARYAPAIRSCVVAATAITPEDLQRDLGMWGGHIFHGELAPDQLFTMRPSIECTRYQTPVRGLYLCGAGTHPGGFMTGASGRLAALEVTRRS